MIPVGQKTGSSSGHVYITDAVPDGTIYYDPKDPEHRFPLKKVGDELINEAYAAKYGHVVRAQTFSDVPSNETGKTNLYERACQYMYKKISELEDTKFEVTMVDMHYLDPDIPMIDLGDKLRLVSSHHGIDKYVYCLSCKIDVLDPEQSSYSFGPMPDEEDPSKSTQSSRSSSGSGEDGIADNNLIKTYDQVAITAKESFAAISKGDFEILGHGTVNITALKEEADNLNGAIITLNDEVKVYGEDIDALKDDKQLVSRITANADEIVLNTSRLYFQDNYSQKKSVSDFKDNNMLYDRT